MHEFAVATQKFTCPGVTAAPPAMTVAVSVIKVPGMTVVTTLPPDVIASVVVVATWADTMEAARSRLNDETRTTSFNGFTRTSKKKKTELTAHGRRAHCTLYAAEHK